MKEALQQENSIGFMNLNVALTRLKESRTTDEQMIHTLERFFAWASIMAIEYSKMDEEDNQLFKVKLVPILVELKGIFSKRGLEKEFFAQAEEALKGLEQLDRKTPVDTISTHFSDDEHHRDTVEYRIDQLPIAIKDEKRKKVCQTRLKIALIAGSMLGAGAAISSSLLWTAEKIHASAASDRAGNGIVRTRSEVTQITGKEFHLTKDHALDLYIKNICQAGPLILCDGLQEAREKTMIKINNHEDADFRIKMEFLKNLELAILKRKTGGKRSREAALEYVRVQRQHLIKYNTEKKWENPNSGDLLKRVRPEESGQN